MGLASEDGARVRLVELVLRLRRFSKENRSVVQSRFRSSPLVLVEVLVTGLGVREKLVDYSSTKFN